MKITEEQRTEIRMSLFEKIKDEKTRSRILTIGFHYANENPKDEDALDEMVYFLTENPERVDELFPKFAGATSIETETETETSQRKRKKG